MATVRAQASMSLDGFIEDSSGGGFDQLFAWHGNGDVEIPSADPRLTFHVSEASAGYLRESFGAYRALVVGRRQFDYTNGWGGRHPMGAPVFVVTHSVPADWVQAHPDAPFTFVTEGGVPSAIRKAKAIAGDRCVAIGPGQVAGEALDAGLLDEVRIDLVPVLLGAGKPLFGTLSKVPVALGTQQVIEGKGVTHLIYQLTAG